MVFLELNYILVKFGMNLYKSFIVIGLIVILCEWFIWSGSCILIMLHVLPVVKNNSLTLGRATPNPFETYIWIYEWILHREQLHTYLYKYIWIACQNGAPSKLKEMLNHSGHSMTHQWASRNPTLLCLSWTQCSFPCRMHFQLCHHPWTIWLLREQKPWYATVVSTEPEAAKDKRKQDSRTSIRSLI